MALNVKNQRIGSIGCRLIILSPPRPRALVAVLVYLTKKKKKSVRKWSTDMLSTFALKFTTLQGKTSNHKFFLLFFCGVENMSSSVAERVTAQFPRQDCKHCTLIAGKVTEGGERCEIQGHRGEEEEEEWGRKEMEEEEGEGKKWEELCRCDAIN